MGADQLWTTETGGPYHLTSSLQNDEQTIKCLELGLYLGQARLCLKRQFCARGKEGGTGGDCGTGVLILPPRIILPNYSEDQHTEINPDGKAWTGPTAAERTLCTSQHPVCIQRMAGLKL